MDIIQTMQQAEALGLWLFSMKKPPNIVGRMTHGLHLKKSPWIPEKVHQVITMPLRYNTKVSHQLVNDAGL